MKINLDPYFFEIAKPIIEKEEYKSMKNYVAHGHYSVYDHCLRVASYAYSFAKNHLLNLDYKALIVGSLLHDYYLYDWHVKEKGHGLHGFRHPYFALHNARKTYNLSLKEMHMIRTHMFPLTFWTIPLCKEAWVLTLADKICAFDEHSVMKRRKKAEKKARKQQLKEEALLRKRQALDIN